MSSGELVLWNHATHLRVNIGVLLQAYSVPEGFATYFTSEGPGPTMRPSYVDLQAMGSGEYLKNKMSAISPGGSFVYIFDFNSFSLILSFCRPCKLRDS